MNLFRGTGDRARPDSPGPPQARQGRDAEFTEFARAAQAGLLRTAWLLTGERCAAEDAVQEALTRTYVAWRRVRPDTAVAYARRALVNLVIDGQRRHRRGHAVAVANPEDAERVPPSAVGPQGVVDDRDVLVRALALLAPRERAVVVLRYYADLSEHQTAHELGISAGTVKSTASRALARLRLGVPALDPSVTSTTGSMR
ncbi:MAG: SigE family RNA polymerase sigma factor [Kineosporiaceae bacterium]